MYRNLYTDPRDEHRWFYYAWEKFRTKQQALSYAMQYCDFRTTYRKTIKFPENIPTVTITSRSYVDKSLFQ